MKSLLISVLCALLVIGARATVITVSNDPSNVGMYSTIQEAIDAASDGDTLLIAGSQNYYGGPYGYINISKPLVIIGAGYEGALPTNIIQEIRLDPAIGDLSGTVLKNLRLGSIDAYSSGPLRNITITSCYVQSSFELSSSIGQNVRENWVIEKSILRFGITLRSSGSALPPSNIIVRNNIILGGISYLKGSSILFTNNIFGNNSSNAFNGVEGAIFTNNIFFTSSPQGCDLCNFTYNISFAGTTTAFNYGNNTANNNLENTNPQFENVPSTDNWDPTFDYRLKSTSPGKNAGSDGTDIGIYGGIDPFPFSPDNPYSDNPIPPGIPRISQMDILNPSLNNSDQLRIRLQADVNN